MGKTIIYQMLPRLWGEGRFSSIDGATFDYLRSLSITHIWYTGVIRHSTAQPFVKGNPGSPYAIEDYYDVSPYLADDEAGRMAEFEDLVRRTHDAGFKVIIDFVPNHVGRDYGQVRSRTDVVYLGDEDDRSEHWKPENDFFYSPGQALRLPMGLSYDEFPARATGNCYTPAPSADDWYDTVKINYCDFHTGTWDRMLDILRYWISKGVDGFRCDMAELVPREFFKWAISSVKTEHPGTLFIAEVYTKENYAAYIKDVGFDLLYDKSGLYDSLRAVVEANSPGRVLPPEMWQSTRTLTWNWQYLGGLQSRMLNFLENHDEQRFASKEFAADSRRTFAPLVMSSAFNTAPFMIYFGEEVGESAPESGDGRTSIFNFIKVGSLQRLYSHLHGGKECLTEAEQGMLVRFRNTMTFAASPVAADGGTYDLCFCNTSSAGFDSDRHFAFLRYNGNAVVLVLLNFSAAPADVEVCIPEAAASLTGVRCGSIKVHAEAYDASITSIK